MMPDLERFGGVTGWVGTAALGDAWHLPLASRLFPELTCHLMAASPTAYYLEPIPWAGAAPGRAPPSGRRPHAAPRAPRAGWRLGHRRHPALPGGVASSTTARRPGGSTRSSSGAGFSPDPSERAEGGEQFVVRREPVDAVHAVALSLDVGPADHALAVDQELAGELRLVALYVEGELVRLDAVLAVAAERIFTARKPCATSLPRSAVSQSPSLA